MHRRALIPWLLGAPALAVSLGTGCSDDLEPGVLLELLASNDAALRPELAWVY